jgi:hypothetical protein
MTTPVNEPIVLHMKSWRQRNCWARLPRPNGGRWWIPGAGAWGGGTPGRCAVWYCRTPWGAVWGAWKLHQLHGPLYMRKRVLLCFSLVLTVVASVLFLAIGVITGWSAVGLLAEAGGDCLAVSAVLQWIATSKHAR